MLAITLWLFDSFFPRVENPWPDTIGLGFPITMAGVGGFLGGLAFSAANSKRRDVAIRWGGVVGFLIGAALYFISLLTQVASSL